MGVDHEVVGVVFVGDISVFSWRVEDFDPIGWSASATNPPGHPARRRSASRDTLKGPVIGATPLDDRV